jgi:hypothetical protein
MTLDDDAAYDLLCAVSLIDDHLDPEAAWRGYLPEDPSPHYWPPDFDPEDPRAVLEAVRDALVGILTSAAAPPGAGG